MDPPLVGSAVTKWIHLTSACVLVGSLVYLRFLVIPLASRLPADQRDAVWKPLFRNTLRWALYALILLSLTGIDNIMKSRKTLPALMDPAKIGLYWTLFWTKVILVGAALVMIHLLMVRIPAFARIRENYRPWVGLLLAVSLVVLFLSGYLTLMRISVLTRFVL